MEKYGHFSKDGLEFIVTEPITPKPWINYLTNEEYCAIISQCAGGYSFYKDCRSDRILRWLPEDWHFDRPGRYIYIKEQTKTKEQRVWSVTYQPLRVKPDLYRCRHGLGYTTIETEYFKINSKVTYFVPSQDSCEIWLVELINKSNKKRSLELYPYVEWLLGDYHLELRYRNIMNLYNRVWFDKEKKAIFAKKTASWQELNISPFRGEAFFSSSLPISGYVTRKTSFLGLCNTEERPQMLSKRFKSVESCSGEDGIAVFKHKILLKEGEKKEFVILLGQNSDLKKVSEYLKKYQNTETAKKELQLTKEIWKKRILDNIFIKTPDRTIDLMANIWLKYQLYICNFWSRSPSYYHEGSGGRGFRDSCQDSEALCSINSEHTKKKIFSLLSLIRRDGTCAPGWSDTRGPHHYRPNKDHPIWLAQTVSAYIKETGDKDFLFKLTPYLKDRWIKGWEIDSNWKGGSIKDGEGTVFEHLEKNLDFTFNDTGQKGLPLIGHADWNDAIDSAGIRLKGESVWLAQALVRSLKTLAELADLIGEKTKADELREKAKVMTERINNLCWDGEWYARGFTDSGIIYGSKENKEGKIFINAQSWAMLSGVADREKTKKILKSVEKYLEGEHGIALFWPAYSEWHSELGRISMFSEGTKENAAVFCHAALFYITALLQIGEADRAYKNLKRITPNCQKNYSLYKAEPYVFAEYLIGPQHPYLYGEGAFSWITGTAGWAFMVITEWLLGAKRDYEGLKISPCIPKDWKECFIRRPFRGAIYEITILNPKGLQRGVKEIYVDGEKIEGDLIKPHSDGKIYKVKVIMG